MKNPYERHVYRMPPGGTPAAVTTMAGTHAPAVSPDGRHLASIWSDDVTPPELVLMSATAALRRGVSRRRRPPEFSRHTWVRPRYETFTNAVDGFTVHARIFEPAALDRSRTSPGDLRAGLLEHRAQPLGRPHRHAATVPRRSAATSSFRWTCAAASATGEAFREAFLMDYGGKDLDDLQAVVEGLKALAVRRRGPHRHLGQQLRRAAHACTRCSSGPACSRQASPARPRWIRIAFGPGRCGDYADAAVASRRVRSWLGAGARRRLARSASHHPRVDGRCRAVQDDDGVGGAADAAGEGLRRGDGASGDARLDRARALRRVSSTGSWCSSSTGT